MRRAIKIDGIDKELEISRVTAVKAGDFVMHIDGLKDGTVRIIYNSNIIPDIAQVKGITIIREDNEDS